MPQRRQLMRSLGMNRTERKTRKKKKQEAGPIPSYPRAFGRLLRPTENVRWTYSFKPPTLPGQQEYIYNQKWGGECAQLLGPRGTALVLFLFYVNILGMPARYRLSSQLLMLPVPWVLLRVGWSIPLVPPWMTSSRFLAGNRDAELKHTILSSLLLFRVFLSFPFSWPPNDIVHERCLLGLLLHNNNIIKRI